MKKYLLILILISCAAQAQGIRISIKAGYGLRSVRDSNLTILTDSVATRKQIAPQITDSLNLIPRNGGASAKDTITLSAVVYGPAICPNLYLGDCDTADARVINGADGSHAMWPVYGAGGANAYPHYTLAHATGDWRVAKMAITNFYIDPTVGETWRDTLYTDTTSLVIPRGASLFVAYTGKATYSYAAAYKGLRSTTASQQVRVYYVPYTTTDPLYTGHYMVPCSTPVQVPLMLGYSAPKGLVVDGWLTVTVTLVQR